MLIHDLKLIKYDNLNAIFVKSELVSLFFRILTDLAKIEKNLKQQGTMIYEYLRRDIFHLILNWFPSIYEYSCLYICFL